MKITRVPIIKGQLLLDGDRYLGMMYLVDFRGTRQLHSENKKLPALYALREGKKFIEKENAVITGHTVQNKKASRLIELMGFERIAKKGNLVIYRKG